MIAGVHTLSPPTAFDGDRPVAAVSTARAAQRAWSKRPITDRLKVIREFRHRLVEHADEFVEALRLPHRGTDQESLMGEVLPLAEACRFLERRAAGILRPRAEGRRGRPAWLRGIELVIHREPFGVVLVIGPSNYPLFLPGVQVLQALTAGNAVVLKPGRHGAPVAACLRRTLADSGLDEGLMEVLDEDPRSATGAIHAGVDKIFITGSTASGAAVLREAAGLTTPVVAELSGCDAVFVLDDADLLLAAKAVAYALAFNGGATCLSPRRVFVWRGVASRFEQLLAAEVRKRGAVRIDQPSLPKANELIREALEAGARGVVMESHREGSGTMTPIVLADAKPTMRLLQEDVFVPVTSLVAVSDESEALKSAEVCGYALGATVFGSTGRAKAMARALKVGSVMVNDILMPTADPRVPFAGRMRSGFGVTRGAEGLLEMTCIKAVSTRALRWWPHLEAPAPGDEAMFRDYLRAACGRGWSARVAAMFRFLAAASKRSRRRKDTRE